MVAGLKPELDRRWLFGIAGAAWSIAGLILLGWAVVWLSDAWRPAEVVLVVFGAVGAVAFVRYGFLRIVNLNIERIERGPDRACAFAFQAWKSWAVMLSMIALGVVLRHSGLPRLALAVLYEVMGGALLGASLLYHRRFIEAMRLGKTAS